MKLGTHIDHTHSIPIGRLGEKYYLMIVIDGIDYLLHEFLTMSRLKIMTKMRELRGSSQFAKNTFDVFSVVPTCLTDSDLIH